MSQENNTYTTKPGAVEGLALGAPIGGGGTGGALPPMTSSYTTSGAGATSGDAAMGMGGYEGSTVGAGPETGLVDSDAGVKAGMGAGHHSTTSGTGMDMGPGTGTGTGDGMGGQNSYESNPGMGPGSGGIRKLVQSGGLTGDQYVGSGGTGVAGGLTGDQYLGEGTGDFQGHLGRHAGDAHSGFHDQHQGSNFDSEAGHGGHHHHHHHHKEEAAGAGAAGLSVPNTGANTGLYKGHPLGTHSKELAVEHSGSTGAGAQHEPALTVPNTGANTGLYRNHPLGSATHNAIEHDQQDNVAVPSNVGTGSTTTSVGYGAGAGALGAGAIGSEMYGSRGATSGTGTGGASGGNMDQKLKQELKAHQDDANLASEADHHPESKGPHGLVWHNGQYVHQRELDHKGSTGVNLDRLDQV